MKFQWVVCSCGLALSGCGLGGAWVEFAEAPNVPPYHDPSAPAPFTTWSNFVAQYTESPSAMRTGVSYTLAGPTITPSANPYYFNNGSEGYPLGTIVRFDANRHFRQLSLSQSSYDLPGVGYGDAFVALSGIGEPGFEFGVSPGGSPSPFISSANNGPVIVLAANPLTLGWEYQSFGVWDSNSLFGRDITTATFGAATPAGSVPTAGTAIFSGKLSGLYVSPSGDGAIAVANLIVNVNFQSRSLGFASSGTTLTRDLATTTSAANLNLNGTLGYSPSSNLFAGPLTNAGGTMSGQSTGKFYGPAGQELGGVFTVRSPTTSELFSGAYGAKR